MEALPRSHIARAILQNFWPTGRNIAGRLARNGSTSKQEPRAKMRYGLGTDRLRLISGGKQHGVSACPVTLQGTTTWAKARPSRELQHPLLLVSSI